VTNIDSSVMVARMQALSAAVSAIGPALEQAAPTGEFEGVLANANAVLNATANPAAAAPTSTSSTTITPAASILGLGGSAMSGAGPSVSGASVVADAQDYLGVPYQWGGTNPSTGLDCSGFVQRVYGDLGISLPRTSQQQATVGTAVAGIADAQPGDLVFFEPGADGPGHVGIYIGNGQMIDAPHTGTSVQIQPVGEPSAIRRVLSPPGNPITSAVDLPGAIPSSLDVPSTLVPLFESASAKTGVPVSLLAAVAKQESGFNANAVSSAGAQGMMQLMPSTASGLGVNAFDPAQAIGGAAQLLGSYLQRYNGSVPLALAAYNAGPGAVARYGGVPPYAQTTGYVNNILAMLGTTS
jgi:cell wall-associated NlpC family hydrolase